MSAKTRLEQLEAMIRDEPNDPELLYMLAMEHASAGSDVDAIRCFEDLMLRCPDYAPGYHQAGRTLVRLNRIDDARTVLQRGIPVATRLNNLHAAGEMQDLLGSLE